VSGLPPTPLTAPRGVAAVSTGAAGAEAAAAGAICSAASMTAGTLSSEGLDTESSITAREFVDARGVEVSVPPIPETGLSIADRRAVGCRSEAGDPASVPTPLPEFDELRGACPLSDVVARAPRDCRGDTVGVESVASAAMAVSPAAPVSAAATAGIPVRTAPTPRSTASAPTRPT